MSASQNNQFDRPFAATPNPKFLYRSQSMDHALKAVSRCIERAEGVACIIGSSGLGKSLLCHALVNQYEERLSVVLLNSARLCTRRALLQNILFELHLPYRDREEGELRLGLTEFLRSPTDCPEGLLLVIDEAQALPTRLLEEMRMLTNFVMDGRPCVRLVLAGNHVLEERLATAAFESFNQRIVTRCYLDAMTSDETRNYVEQQLSLAEPKPSCRFEKDSLRTIHTATSGVPRLVNQLCDHALYLADTENHSVITSQLIQEAWADLQQLPAPWQTQPPTSSSSESGSSVVEFGELDEGSDIFSGTGEGSVWSNDDLTDTVEPSSNDVTSETLSTSPEVDELILDPVAEEQDDDREPFTLKLPNREGFAKSESWSDSTDDYDSTREVESELEANPAPTAQTTNWLKAEQDKSKNDVPEIELIDSNYEIDSEDDSLDSNSGTELGISQPTEFKIERPDDSAEEEANDIDDLTPLQIDDKPLFPATSSGSTDSESERDEVFGLDLDATDYLGLESSATESGFDQEVVSKSETANSAEIATDVVEPPESQVEDSPANSALDSAASLEAEDSETTEAADAKDFESESPSDSTDIEVSLLDKTIDETNQSSSQKLASQTEPVQVVPTDPFEESYDEEVLIEDAYRCTVTAQLATSSWTQPHGARGGELLPHIESLKNGTYEQLPFAVNLNLATLSPPKQPSVNPATAGTDEILISDDLPELIFEHPFGFDATETIDQSEAGLEPLDTDEPATQSEFEIQDAVDDQLVDTDLEAFVEDEKSFEAFLETQVESASDFDEEIDSTSEDPSLAENTPLLAEGDEIVSEVSETKTSSLLAHLQKFPAIDSNFLSEAESNTDASEHESILESTNSVETVDEALSIDDDKDPGIRTGLEDVTGTDVQAVAESASTESDTEFTIEINPSETIDRYASEILGTNESSDSEFVFEMNDDSDDAANKAKAIEEVGFDFTVNDTEIELEFGDELRGSAASEEMEAEEEVTTYYEGGGATSDTVDLSPKNPARQDGENHPGFGLGQIAEMEEIDERLLREIVSFRDAVGFDPASDPVMPEFRPPVSAQQLHSNDGGEETFQTQSVSSEQSDIASSAAETVDEDGLPEIVLIEPPQPKPRATSTADSSRSSDDDQEESEPTGHAHREDYNSLFDRLKGN